MTTSAGFVFGAADRVVLAKINVIGGCSWEALAVGATLVLLVLLLLGAANLRPAFGVCA